MVLSLPALDVGPKPSKRSRRLPTCCLRWLQFARDHPFYKLMFLAGLALYDIIGDVTFLVGVERTPLEGYSSYQLLSWDGQQRQAIPTVPLTEWGTLGANHMDGSHSYWDYSFAGATTVVGCATSAWSDLAQHHQDSCDLYLELVRLQEGRQCLVREWQNHASTTVTYPMPSCPNTSVETRVNVVSLTMPEGYRYFPSGEWHTPDLQFQLGIDYIKMKKLGQQEATCKSKLTTSLRACLDQQAGGSGQVSLDNLLNAGTWLRELQAWQYINLNKSGSVAIPVKVICLLAKILLGIILAKECLKAAGVLSFFFHPYFHHPKNFEFISNSPISFFPLLLSPVFREVTISCEESKAHDDSPWPLFWDLLLEDLPQLFLPCLLAYVSPRKSPMVIFSLSGSIAMVVVAVVRLIPKLYREHEKAMSPRDAAGIVLTGRTAPTHPAPSALQVLPSTAPVGEELEARVTSVEVAVGRIAHSQESLERRFAELERLLVSVTTGRGDGLDDGNGPTVV